MYVRASDTLTRERRSNLMALRTVLAGLVVLLRLMTNEASRSLQRERVESALGVAARSAAPEVSVHIVRRLRGLCVARHTPGFRPVVILVTASTVYIWNERRALAVTRRAVSRLVHFVLEGQTAGPRSVPDSQLQRPGRHALSRVRMTIDTLLLLERAVVTRKALLTRHRLLSHERAATMAL